MAAHNQLTPMLNAYPDSMGGKLSYAANLLEGPLKDCFGAFYILPSLFHSDLDRGFCVVDYGINEELASAQDLQRLQAQNILLKLDFVLNHISVQSPQFQDMLAKGEDSEYKDFFINWNKFWEGAGTMTSEGYIQPDPKLIEHMFFRKPGMPLLMVEFPDGSLVPYWNTFYQEVTVDEMGKKHYLGQMDLNIKSPKVWEYYDEVLRTLKSYGASIVRLDAFAYAPKEVGARNFMNEPGTWELLSKVRKLADQYDLLLLPEIHASYGEKTYDVIGGKGYMVYDFFLPGLIIDALENHSGGYLKSWAEEIIVKGYLTVNMLGCHDGIPLLDLKGLLPEEQIQGLIDKVVGRGGYVKDLHGQKNVYYQVNATYYSALGEDDRKMLLARALQLFMPGKPQVWYLDLFAGKNDHEAVRRAGAGGHKEINRTNLSQEAVEEALALPLVQDQIKLLRFRNDHPAFREGAAISVDMPLDHQLCLTWKTENAKATLQADLCAYTFNITAEAEGTEPFCFSQE